MFKRPLAFALGAVFLALSFNSASAQTVTPGTAFQVQVTVTAGCLINTDVAGPVDFGSAAGTASPPANQNRTPQITCTNGANYAVYFTSANAMTGTNRFMINGAESIGYQILNGATPVGDTAASGISATGNGLAQSYPLVFNINAWSAVTPNLYSDTVTMQVEY